MGVVQQGQAREVLQEYKSSDQLGAVPLQVRSPLSPPQSPSTEHLGLCHIPKARGLEDLHTLQEAQGHRCVYNIPSTKGHHIPPVLSQHPLDPSTEWELEMGAQGPPCVC